MKKIIGSVAISCVLFVGLFLFFEADLVGAANQTASTTPTSTLNFNVTLTVGSEISLICPSTGDVALAGISGLSGGASSVTAACGVNTNNALGYNLTIKATSTPAMMHSGGVYAIPDYTETTPEYNWALDAVTTSTFGYAVSSTDVVTAFKNNGSACGGAGTLSDFGHCFRSLTTSPVSVATRAIATPSTVTTTVNFKVEVGNQSNQPTGNYTSTIVVTANTL